MNFIVHVLLLLVNMLMELTSCIVTVSEHVNGAGRCVAQWCCVMRLMVTEGVSSFKIYQLSAVID